MFCSLPHAGFLGTSTSLSWIATFHLTSSNIYFCNFKLLESSLPSKGCSIIESRVDGKGKLKEKDDNGSQKD